MTIPAPRLPAGYRNAPSATLGTAVRSMSLDELRGQRARLAEELGNVTYWRRMVRAQTDLLVAGLLYPDHVNFGDLTVPPHGRPHTGARLEHLRETGARLTAYEIAVREDLDVVTTELAGRVIDPAVAASVG